MRNEITGVKLAELAKRARSVKNDPRLRHAPNRHDLAKASENAKLMQGPQYQAIKPEGGAS